MTTSITPPKTSSRRIFLPIQKAKNSVNGIFGQILCRQILCRQILCHSAFVCALGLGSTAAHAQDPAANQALSQTQKAASASQAMAQRLAALREEVAGLGDAVGHLREEQSQELRSLAEQKASLEAEARREGLRLAQIKSSLARIDNTSRDQSADEKAFVPVVLGQLAKLRGHIEEQIPFQQEGRLAAVDGLLADVRSGKLRIHQAAQKVWLLLQDEERLGQESALDRQSVLFEGTTQLADVLRLGMIGLFLKTPDGRFGISVREAGSWGWKAVSGAEAEALAKLFDGFRKQMRTGLYAVPVPTQGGGDR